MHFRKDINGLRAIAVIAVVLFHFNFSWLSGGFAGVDVFFVISGFLMTGIIFRGIEQENFSIMKFYVARANRIIPSLAVLCFVLLILGWFFMTTWDYKTLGRDSATSMLFVSNIMYSLRSGYFDTGDNFLLHTWSLSVEWQFYILYPIILVLLKKITHLDNIKKIVLITCFIFFIYSVYSTIKSPITSYFLLPSRAWEMLVGGLAYLYPLRIKSDNQYISNKNLEALGIILILLSYYFISSSSAWPGYLAAAPVIGTWLVLQSNRNESYITGNLFFQKIGLWSYSIYLWHWPVAVSFNYYNIDAKYRYIGIFLSLLLGYLSFSIIEKRRFQSKKLIKPIISYTFLAGFFSIIGLVLFKTQGVASRVDLASNSVIQGGTANNYAINEGVSFLNTDGNYDYVLIGDSNSNHYTRGIIKKGTKIKSSWYATCLSFPNSINKRSGYYPEWEQHCQENYKAGVGSKSKIILAQSWVRSDGDLRCTSNKCSLTGVYRDDLRYQLKDFINFYNDREIYIVGELPKPKNNEIMTCIKTNKILGLNLNCRTHGEPKKSSGKINEIISSVAADHANVSFIDPGEAICSEGKCHYNIDGNSIFMSDGGHLSGYGSEYIWEFIMRNIEI